MADRHTSGVHPLDDLDDFKVAHDDIDPRGWAVYSQDGQRLGEVKDLLVDTAAMQVRYLAVDLDRDVAGASGSEGGSRRVLFPVGTARLDDSDDRVFVDTTAAGAAGIPAYTAGAPVTRDYENSVRRGFVTAAGTTAGTEADPGEITAAELDYYNHDHYDTGRFYGARTRSTDAAPAAARAAGANASAGADQEVRMVVNAEEAVITKRLVVKEEIIIRKRAVTENHFVDTSLRTERVEIERDMTRDAGGTSTGDADPRV